VRAGQGWIAGGFVPLSQLWHESGIRLTSVSDKPILHAQRLDRGTAWPAAPRRR
jgi:hypothetical protein